MTMHLLVKEWETILKRYITEGKFYWDADSMAYNWTGMS